LLSNEFLLPRTAVRRVLIMLSCLAAVPWALSGSAGAQPRAISCGVAEEQPVWIDYVDSTVEFWRERFGQPGVVIATGGPTLGAEMRATGAATVHFDLYLRRRVGTPSAPMDPDSMDKRADGLFDYAVEVTGCELPMIALNELWGASLPTPWTVTTERYRSNVLRFLQRLAERGARPALLVSSTPTTGGEAAAWWRAVGQVSDIVLENYWNANVISRAGPVGGSRMLRTDFRGSAATLLAIGVPASRIGLMLGFHTTPGTGGREGLKPREKWFEVGKLQALAGRQVARELGLAHVWSWGWTMRTEAGKDPDKTLAACVWLWVRDESLCDAPELAGPKFDKDVRVGQIDLPSAVRCKLGDATLTSRSVSTLRGFTGDWELALTALVVRRLEREVTDVSDTDVLAAERRVVVARFGGSREAYRAALARVRAGVPIARGILGDELRRLELQARLRVSRPAPAVVRRYLETHDALPARLVTVSPAPSWLAEGTGYALGPSAPARVFRAPAGRTVVLQTVEGRFTLRALDEPTVLGALPLNVARPAVARELVLEQRADAYTVWTLRRQNGAENRLVCQKDRLPGIGVVTLSSFAPFLALHEAGAQSTQR
jgi:hypothetical protein